MVRITLDRHCWATELLQFVKLEDLTLKQAIWIASAIEGKGNNKKFSLQGIDFVVDGKVTKDFIEIEARKC